MFTKSIRYSFFLSMAAGLLAAAVFKAPAQAQDGRSNLLIAFDGAVTDEDVAVVEGIGGQIKYRYRLVPAVAASLPNTLIDALRVDRRVVRIEPDRRVFAIDAELDNTWGVKRIGAGTVHSGGNKGTAVKVAVIDTGIDYNHLDLKWRFVGGKDFVNDDDDPLDDNGHGTHVAGTVAAEDDDEGVVGAAPEVSLYGLKVLDASGSGNWSDVIAALQWCVDNGIEVSNNSYGSGSDPGQTVEDAFNNAAAAGILHIAAAGNSGNPPGKGDNVGYPARYASVVAVAATGKNDNRASFSSTGPDVELAAPGVAINSSQLGGGYVEYSGTSMASPHVAGTAALVIAGGITDADGDGLINDEVRARLQATAEDLGNAGRDAHYGYGLVDADGAAAASESTSEEVGTVSGTVTDASTGSAIDGATVTVDTGQSTTTASDGTYTIDDVPTGDRTVSTSAEGYESESIVATVSEDLTTVVDFALNRQTDASTVSVSDISYTTEGGKNQDKHLNVTVTLVDDLGSAVSGASVSIDLYHDGSLAGSGTGTTGTDGAVTFSIKNASPGCYTTDVTDVTASGLTWDGTTPSNERCK